MILLTGALGYVGTLIRRRLGKKHELVGVDIRGEDRPGIYRCDLGETDDVRKLAASFRPDLVIHAAGNKDIGFCERNPADAFRINCKAAKNLSENFVGQCRIIYISTDYVFRGDRGRYAETDDPDPVTVYGKSKLCGETEGAGIAGERYTVLRTSAIFDLEATFPRFLKSALDSGRTVECFTDVLYSPTYYRDFLDVLEMIVGMPPGNNGPFHVCGDATSRLGFGRAFAEAFGYDPALVVPSRTDGRIPFLFPDLSMDDSRTRRLLRTSATPVEKALRELKEERANAVD